jgi:hypothetical protein
MQLGDNVMADGATAITTGIFTLAGALGGASLSTLSAVLIVRRNEKRQDLQELRRERIRIYGSFLQVISALETSAEYLSSVLRRSAHGELDKAWSAASASSDRAMHAFSELELFAGAKVQEEARKLLALAQNNYKSKGQGGDGVRMVEARAATATAMQAELGIVRRDEDDLRNN